MLKNIKSPFIMKKLFSYIVEKQKLKLLRYNKSLQKNINISITIIIIEMSPQNFHFYEEKNNYFSNFIKCKF